MTFSCHINSSCSVTCGGWLVYPLWVGPLIHYSSLTISLKFYMCTPRLEVCRCALKDRKGDSNSKTGSLTSKTESFKDRKSYFKDGNSYMCIAHICAVAHTLELNEWCNFFPQHWLHLHVVSICARMSTDSWGITCSHPEKRIWVSVIGCVEKGNTSSK